MTLFVVLTPYVQLTVIVVAARTRVQRKARKERETSFIIMLAAALSRVDVAKCKRLVVWAL